jgi:threonine/homoserine/homoserine lactone efflux protein
MMPDVSTLVPFVIASAILVLIPGPAVLYIISTGIGRGRRMAMASMLGIEIGATFHVAAAALGLSAVIASSALAYSFIKYVGAAYLVFLGIKSLRSGGEGHPLRVPGAVSARTAFIRGVVVNALNPKLALFFLAFLPQFVDSNGGPVAPQLLMLGGLFIGVAIVIDSTYALASGLIGNLLRRSPRFGSTQAKVAGVTYLALGASAAVSGK